MKRQKNIFLFLFVCVFVQLSTFNVDAQDAGAQFAGGAINYSFIGKTGNDYQYKIVFSMYRLCNHPADLDDPVLKIINTLNISQNTHPLTYQEITLSNPEIKTLPYTKAGSCVINEPNDCLELRTYTTTISLAHSPEGYTLFYTYCCRNAINNLQSDTWNSGIEMINQIPSPGQALTFTATIPSHDVITANSNAVSIADSIIYSCINKPFSYTFQFTDADGDSLVIKPALPYGKTPVATTYFQNIPLQSSFQLTNPTGSAPSFGISNTGVLNGVPTKAGRFNICLQIEEYRNGVVINTTRKEYQLNVRNCALQQPSDIINCSVNLAYFTHNNSPENKYRWDFGVANISSDTSTIAQPIYVYPATGTYYAKMVVTNKSGCSDSAIVKATMLSGSIDIDFNWQGKQCEGHPIQLNDQTVTHGTTITKWTWRNANLNTIVGNTPTLQFIPKVSGNMPYPLGVRLTVETASGCKDSLLKDILIHQNAVADAGEDKILSFGTPYQIAGNSTKGIGITYKWQPATGLSNATIPDPVVLHNTNITYYLTVSNSGNCSDTDTVKFTYMKGPDVYVADAFTPNRDGKNDVLHCFPVGVELSTFSIMNRWGQTVFSTANANVGWNGKLNNLLQETGVYIWLAKGKTVNGEAFIKRGTFLLLR